MHPTLERMTRNDVDAPHRDPLTTVAQASVKETSLLGSIMRRPLAVRGKRYASDA